MNIKGAKILITGGSSGIGRATAEILAQNGAEVLITGRDAAKVAGVASEIGTKGLAFDVGNHASIKENAAKALEILGGLDILINNAGIGNFALLDDLSYSDFEQVFSVNVFGLALLTQEYIPHFKENGGGHIINIGSTAAAKGFAYGSVYAASKFALRGMTQCWQAELRKFDVRVVLVNPSEVTTAFNNPEREERPDEPKKLRPLEIAHTIKSVLEMDNRGFIPEVAIWATNPWEQS